MIASQIDDLIYRWQWQLGRILQHNNQKEQALIAYQSAYQATQSLRQDLDGINPERQFGSCEVKVESVILATFYPPLPIAYSPFPKSDNFCLSP